jgi:hypothetical protein
MSQFKEALLSELVTHVRPAATPAATPRRWHRIGRLSLAAAALAAVAAAVVGVLNPVSGSAAFAVSRNGDGTVSITFRELADPVAATNQLRTAGVPAKVVRMSEPGTCPDGAGPPWYQPVPGPAIGNTPTMSLIELRSPDFPESSFVTDATPNGITIDPGRIPAGAEVFFIEYVEGGTHSIVSYALARSPAPTCWAVS